MVSWVIVNSTMPPVSPYLRLMRLHQPVGIWLLLWPCWWALSLVHAPLAVYVWFALGAVAMRSAGCILNDMADRHFDRQVERTKSRPLASGELSMWQASILLGVLLLLSFGVAIALGWQVVLWGAIALVPVTLYPFMKRITWWPQLFLGLTFNWGALMGFIAAGYEFPPAAALALYAGSIFWTLGYDTIYAHQDKKDDAQVGVKSTALYLGQRTKPAVAAFYALAVLGWGGASYLMSGSIHAGLLALIALHLAWQIRSVQLDAPSSCLSVFKSNTWLGAVVMAAFYFA